MLACRGVREGGLKDFISRIGADCEDCTRSERIEIMAEIGRFGKIWKIVKIWKRCVD